jgi:hypothetical protein
MRITLLCIAVAAMVSSAPAAVVTYRMSYHDNGAGIPTANNWAVYASVSPDAGGLVEYNIDLLPYTFGGMSSNRGNGVVMSNPDTEEQRSLGFTAGRVSDALQGRYSGAQELSGGVPLIPIYGVGQQADDLDNYIPPDFTQQDAVFGAGRSPYGVQTFAGRNLFLIARGSWSGSVLPAFDSTSADTSARVWNSRSGLETSPATLIFDYSGPCGLGDCFSMVSLRNFGVSGSNLAVGGSIAVNGNNNRYISEVDQLTSDLDFGHAPIQTIGDESGNIYVMARLNGTAADIAALLGSLFNDVDATDSQFAALHAAYDGQFGSGGFNALFKFLNIQGAKVFDWDFRGHPGVTVDQLAAVPEPSSFCLLLGGVLMIARRRRWRRV